MNWTMTAAMAASGAKLRTPSAMDFVSRPPGAAAGGAVMG
jgi:hypothetical protein